MQAAQGMCVSGGRDVDCRGCGECVDMCSGDELGDAVNGVVGDAECCEGDECDIDHGNISGTLDPNFLNPRSEKCALQIRLLTVISVSVLPMRSNHVRNNFLSLNGNL